MVPEKKVEMSKRATSAHPRSTSLNSAEFRSQQVKQLSRCLGPEICDAPPQNESLLG